MTKIILLFATLYLSGCATPSQRFHQKTIDLGFNSEIIETSHFQHQIYSSNFLSHSKTLHIYLDGDGTPWEKKRWIATDPTARNPLILRLMKQDKTPSMLIGRPCYYGLNKQSQCDNKYWTSDRYSNAVVLSMTQAINGWLKKYNFNHVVLIGYSGGGSIAALMANNINHIKTLVTIAANLDVKAWSKFHGYSTLKGSLNPIEQGRLNPMIKQLHFAGKKDQTVPAFVINNYVLSQKNANYFELEDQDHSCCWEDEWLNLLGIIKNSI